VRRSHPDEGHRAHRDEAQSRDARQVHRGGHLGRQRHQGEPNRHRCAGRQWHPDGRRDHPREGHRAAAEWAYPTTTSAGRHRAAAEWACQKSMWAESVAGPAGGRAAGRQGDQVRHQQGAAPTGPERWKLPEPRQRQGEQPDAGGRRRWADCW